MFRRSGEAVLIDFGLSHHNQLPDLLQEEFRLPYGTAPYMAPERLLGVRDDPRSDLFSLGVLLYFFTTGERPFGESETLRGHAPAAVARSVSAAQAEAGLSAVAAGDRAAVPGDRAGLAASDRVATGVRTGPSRAGQIDRAVGAPRARSAEHGAAPPLQSRPDASRSRNPMSPRNWHRDRSSSVALDIAEGAEAAERGAAHHRRSSSLATLPIGAAGLPQRAQARPHHHRQDAGRAGQKQAHRPARRAPALGVAATSSTKAG